jgi:hypothetical protein
VARGYLHRPTLTAERFVPDPFGRAPGARLYRTGDRARWRSDGTLEFLGRLDQQVKLRGYRIEPGEIETVLARHPAVREAVAVVREVQPGDTRLVAYVVPTPGAAATADELRHWAQAQLPAYMVPAAFVPMADLPLTPTGKVDRQALPAPVGGASDPSPYVPPRTEIERAIATVWKEVLATEVVGIHDNFFDLGGHSLLLVRVWGRLRGIFRRELSVIDLFRYPTIGVLATYLAQEESEQPASQQTEALRARLEAGKNRLKQQLQHKQRTAEHR